MAHKEQEAEKVQGNRVGESQENGASLNTQTDACVEYYVSGTDLLSFSAL